MIQSQPVTFWDKVKCFFTKHWWVVNFKTGPNVCVRCGKIRNN